jgi:hypothetical protein
VRRSQLIIPDSGDQIKVLPHKRRRAAVHIFPVRGNGVGIEFNSYIDAHRDAIEKLHLLICKGEDAHA